MRRHLRLYILAALIGCSAVAIAAAASVPDMRADVRKASTPTLAVERIRVPGGGLRDEAAMVLVGTALIGLGAAVRRAA